MSAEIGGDLIGMGALLLLSPVILAGLAGVGAGVLIVKGAQAAIEAIMKDGQTQKEVQQHRIQATDRENRDKISKAQARITALQQEAARQGRKLSAQEQAQTAALSAVVRACTETGRQREQLLRNFQQQSDAMNDLLAEQNRTAETLQREFREAAVKSEQAMQQLLDKASRLNADASSKLSETTTALCTRITAELNAGTQQVAEQLQTGLDELNRRLNAIEDRLTRQATARVYVQTLMQETDSLYGQLRQEYEAAAPQVQRSLSLRPLEDQRAQIGTMLQQDQGQAALVLAVNLMQQMEEATLKLDQAIYQTALVEQQLAVQAELLKGLMGQKEFAVQQAFQDGRKEIPAQAEYWCDASLTQQKEKAGELLTQWENRQTLTLTAMDRLAGEMKDCVAVLNGTLDQGRQRMLCCLAGWEMMQNAVKAMGLTGWRAKKFGFEKLDDQGRWDYRSPMVTRFGKMGGSSLDLILTPAMQQDGQWGVEIKMDRTDSGVVDERLRSKQLLDMSEKLSQKLRHPVKLRCKAGTEGQNSQRAQSQDRLPDRRFRPSAP